MTVSFSTKYLAPAWQGTKVFAHNYGNFVLGVEQSDAFAHALQASVRGVKDSTGKYVGGRGFANFGDSLSKAWSSSKNVVKDKSFWTVVKDSFSSIPSEFRAANRLVEASGKSTKYIGSTLKILGKRMPLIGNVLMLAMEVPNICRAFSQGGVGTGAVEVGKAAAKLGGFAAGAAIGQALIPIPFVGALIGGVVGGWIADKLVGKSFTEKQEEAKASAEKPQAEEVEPQAQQRQPRLSPAQQQMLMQQLIARQGGANFEGNTNPFASNPAYNMSVDPRERDIMSGR